MELQQHRWDEIVEGYWPYWLVFVPTDGLQPYPLAEDFAPETAAMTELRSYWTRRQVDAEGSLVYEQPPAHVIWSHPRWRVCGWLEFTKRTDHANTGVNTVPCEWVLDWAVWLVEQLASPQLASLDVHEQMRIAAHRWLALTINGLPAPPATADALWNELFVLELNRLRPAIGHVVYWLPSWVKANYDDSGAWTDARDEIGFAAFERFDTEMRAGRRPWETVP